MAESTTWTRIADDDERQLRVATAAERVRVRRSTAEHREAEAAGVNLGEIWMLARGAGVTVWLWTLTDGESVILADVQVDGENSLSGTELWPLIDELARQEGWGGQLRFSEYRGDTLAAELAEASGAARTGTKMQVDVAHVAPPERLSLRTMTDADFAAYTADLSAGFAQELYESGSVGSMAQAQASSELMLRELLSAGLNTPRQHLWTVHDCDDRVGILWLEYRDDRAFIYDIEMLPSARGRGYGTQTLRLAAEQAREAGLPTVALNVFANNAGAQHLYTREGYEATETMWSVQPTGTADE